MNRTAKAVLFWTLILATSVLLYQVARHLTVPRDTNRTGESAKLEDGSREEHQVRSGVSLVQDGKRDEANLESRGARNVNPGNAEAHNKLGLALLEQKKLDEAIAEYREAIRIDPNNSDAHLNMATALRDQGNLDQAIAEYREAIRTNADDPAARFFLGDVLRQKGQRTEAVRELREFLRLTANSGASDEKEPVLYFFIQQARGILIELEKP